MLLEELSFDAEKLVRDAVLECGYNTPMPKLGKHGKEIMEFAIDFMKKHKDDVEAAGFTGLSLVNNLSMFSKKATGLGNQHHSGFWGTASSVRHYLEKYGFAKFPPVAADYEEDRVADVYPRRSIRDVALRIRHAVDYLRLLYAYTGHGRLHRQVGEYEQAIARATLKKLGILNAAN